MIIYDGKKWFYPIVRYFRLFKESYNLKEQARIIGILLFYAIGVTFLLQGISAQNLNINPLYFSLVGVVLSLMLVFRLNTAYDRWYEGRKIWGSLVNVSRNMAVISDAILDENNSHERKQAAMLISAFPYLLKAHLRSEGEDSWPKVVKDLKASSKKALPKHGPAAGIKLLQNWLDEQIKTLDIGLEKRIEFQKSLRDLFDISGGCERIFATPIPFSHSFFIKAFTLLYAAAIPFGVFHFFGWYTILATIFIGFALIGIEIISESIEEPFGIDANDLPLTKISSNILHVVYDTLEVEMAEHLPDDQKDEWIIH